MALEWVVLGVRRRGGGRDAPPPDPPGPRPPPKGPPLKPFLSIVPFCLFLLLDIYWKYETRPSCQDAHACSPSEHLRHQKSVMKSQRNALLIAAAVVFYWLLYSVTGLVVKVEQVKDEAGEAQEGLICDAVDCVQTAICLGLFVCGPTVRTCFESCAGAAGKWGCLGGAGEAGLPLLYGFDSVGTVHTYINWHMN